MEDTFSVLAFLLAGGLVFEIGRNQRERNFLHRLTHTISSYSDAV